MAYRKLAADNIFTGYEMKDNDAVLVIDEKGMVQEVVDVAEAGEGVERIGGMLCPGFVNCHCHLELSHMRGEIPGGTGMIDFLLSVIGKREYAAELIQEAIAKAEDEMIANGIVAVGDICNTNHTLEIKRNRRLYYHSFIEAFGFLDAVADARFEAAVKLYKQFAGVGASSIVPHAPYSVSSTLFSLINAFETGSLLTIHNQESAAENEFIYNASGDFLRLYSSLGTDISHFTGTGNTSLINTLNQLADQHKIILVHNVLTGKEDLEFARRRMDRLHWCLCPNANLYINGQLPDVNLLRQHTGNIVLGTDSLASNHALNLLSEIATLRQHFPGVSFAELLKWGTLNGAKALGIDSVYGSFEKGKVPGIIAVNGDNIQRLA